MRAASGSKIRDGRLSPNFPEFRMVRRANTAIRQVDEDQPLYVPVLEKLRCPPVTPPDECSAPISRVTVPAERSSCSVPGLCNRTRPDITYHCSSACYWRHRRARLRVDVKPRRCKVYLWREVHAAAFPASNLLITPATSASMDGLKKLDHPVLIRRTIFDKNKSEGHLCFPGRSVSHC
jgi:hypothetical protein